MNTIRIKGSKAKLILIILGSLIFIILGLILVINPDNFVSVISKSTSFISIVGILSITFFSSCLIFLIIIFSKRKVNLIINEKGIIDNSSFISIGNISWNDITSINSISVSSNKFLIINVKDPYKYINNQTNIKKNLLQNRLKTYDSPISISSILLACDFNELEKTILKAFEDYKNIKNKI